MKKLDERELQEVNKSGHLAFGLMFLAAVVIILLELVAGQAEIKAVLGETGILFIGGISYIVLLIRHGVWSKNAAPVKSNLILSAIIAFLFAAFLAVIIYRKAPHAELAGMDAWLIYSIGCFFLFFILCMAVLLVLDAGAGRKKKNLERKYREEE